MTARYWRITGIETYGGGDLELSELQLFALDANNNPVRVDQTATLTSSVPPIAGTLSALNDGDTSTTARFPTGPGLAFVWDFGSNQVEPNFLKLDGPDKQGFPRFLVVSCSNDGVVYEKFAIIDQLAYPQKIDVITNYDPFMKYLNFYTDFSMEDCRFYSLAGEMAKIPLTGKSGGVTSAVVGSRRVARYDGTVGTVFTGGVPFEVWTDDFTIECGMSIQQIPGYSLPYYPAFQISSSVSATRFIAIYFDVNFNRFLFEIQITGRSDYVYRFIYRTIQQNYLYHFCVQRKNGTIYIYINGEVVDYFQYNYNIYNFDLYKVANAKGSYDYTTRGDYYYLKIYRGAAKYTGNYTPSDVYGPLFAHTSYPEPRSHLARPEMVAGADVPPFTTATASPPIAIDIIDGGTGRLTGTVREKTGISTRPLKRRVVLLDYRSNRKLRETVSDEQTGVYSFDEIDLLREYTVIALDHTGQYRAVIADKLVPETML